MSRLVDCCPSSDDELPEANATGRPAHVAQGTLSAPMNHSPQKGLIPKSTSKPRRVRRLDGGALGQGNLLLQRFDVSKDSESPRRSPGKREMSRKNDSFLQRSIFHDESLFEASPTKRGTSSKEASIIQPSIFDDDETAPATVRPSRFRRLRPIHYGTDGEEDESIIASVQTSRLAHELSDHRDITHGSDDSSDHSLRSSPDELEKIDEAEQSQIDAQLANDFMAISLTDNTAAGTDTSEEHVPSDVFEHSDDLKSHVANVLSNSASPGDSPLKGDVGSPAASATNKEVLPKKVLHTDSPTKSTLVLNTRNPDLLNHQATPRVSDSKARLATSLFRPSTRPRGSENIAEKVSSISLANELSKLRLDFCESSDQDNDKENGILPETPVKSRKTKRMVSLTKTTGFPKTPHKPSDAAFWDQGMVNDWIDEHSPQKATMPASSISNAKRSPSKDEKRVFDAKKQTIASGFLQELDDKITEGKIGQLAESTGGVSLVWSKTLNTTAGRANWRRETIRTKDADGEVTSVQHKHHASIELAEKVINDEDRLLNVVAHEFCHLANFMICGVTNNPHGKEFKAWAAKCSQVFGDRGIKVTTKHSYDINYKYIWDCVSCGTEFKRHSKSIDPTRHRCGSCKSQLKQVKPVPRGGIKPSAYQVFMKEQMKVLKTNNPGSPQKEIMRMVAEKWSSKQSKATDVIPVEELLGESSEGEMDQLPPVKGIDLAEAGGLPVSQVVDLTLE